MLHEHCASIGRDSADIATSAQLRLGPDGDPAPVVDVAAAFAEAGADLAVVYLPPPHTPAVLGPLAAALSSLRG